MTAGLPAGLGLAARAGQGFVSAEARPTGAVTYKLRWRRGGRQRVRYLGSDPAAARAALAGLQAGARRARALRRHLGLRPAGVAGGRPAARRGGPARPRPPSPRGDRCP